MAELLHVRILDTQEDMTIEDVPPLASAQAFKSLSDQIWAQKPEDFGLACYSVHSQISPIEARDALNEVVGVINEKFVISGISRALDLGQMYGQGEPVIIGAETVDTPTDAAIQTFNWDARCTYRVVENNGDRTVYKFTDGHTDYYRELGAKLWLGTGVVASYTMQRMQDRQNVPTHLSLNVWHTAFAESGYEGHQLRYQKITEKQESDLLAVMQKIGGLEL